MPAVRSWSLSSAMTLAKMGLAQLVPATFSAAPATTISTFWPCAETSGKARPEVLNLPELVVPSAVRYVETAVVWYEGRPKKLENPPEEKVAAVSVVPVVAPTEVMKGQPEGKVGTKVLQLADCEPETPPSPDAKRMDVPRAPS